MIHNCTYVYDLLDFTLAFIVQSHSFNIIILMTCLGLENIYVH
jgi:hypothetical protein